MRYGQVQIESIGYELPADVVTSADLEARLRPLYQALSMKPGQLEALTGVRERRWWQPRWKMCDGAIRAGRKAIEASTVRTGEIGMLIYGGVCRDNLEPATACSVAAGLGLAGHTQIFDISNACLGVMNGIVQVANAIELGQTRAGLVVSCESARQIVGTTIDHLNHEPTPDNFRLSVATLTGGSGAVGVLVAHESLTAAGHRLLGGVIRSNAEHHELCRWGPDTGVPASAPLVMRTDSVGVLQHGIKLGIETWREFRRELDWLDSGPDKLICHQVGSAHQDMMLKCIDMPRERDFTTYGHLGNIGTVSLPLTLAIAAERGFLVPSDRIGLLGIGSGLNCLMMGVVW